MKFGKKALAITDLYLFASVFVTAGISIGIGAQVLNQVGTQVSTGVPSSAVANASQGLAQISSYLPIIGIVLAAAIIISLVAGAFVRGRQ